MSGHATATAAEAGANTTWTREQVEELLRTERFEGNRIDLPYGLRTGGRDHSATARSIYPADMTGRSVLDVGCGTGYFVFEALKRGAGPVLGVDVDRYSLRRARLLADCLGLEARFEPWDIERDAWNLLISGEHTS